MAAALQAGTVSSRELTSAHLDLAERQDRGLNAWLSIDRERALAEADAADARLSGARAEGATALEGLHPLLGVPIALKDLVSVQGGQCTAGSRILEGYRSPYDAHITERLRDVGAVILGKTNMDEFAMGSSTEHSAYGPTANPWDLGRVPGGSSGGSAAAVAAYHAPLSIGTDTGGSIRQPAAMTGIVGMKPTYGRVSRYGIVAFASSLDQIGPFARDARDAAALLHAVAGRDDRDSTSSPTPVPDALLHLPVGDDEAAATLRGKRLGLPREYFVAGMEPGVEARVREAVVALEAAGAIVEEVSLPHTAYGLATYYIVAPAEASANLARYDGIRYGPRLGDGGDVLAGYLATRGQGFGAEVKRRIMLGTYALSAGYYDAYYLKAQKVRSGRRASMRSWRRRRRPWPSASERAWTIRSRCTCPTRARCPSTWRACLGYPSRPGSRRACPSGSSSSARRGRSPRCLASPEATRPSPPTPSGAPWSHPAWPPWTIRPPRPSGAERPPAPPGWAVRPSTRCSA
jgi:aspartyl-tRNA(Asn)/glutamyl-tRNA(Gln) amidotransferase subunit A